ncbi:MAG: response regulator transcription factor [Coriobacteriales bacterium]|nr:response regulator transcription factor [Coriobacteriales bacterium]
MARILLVEQVDLYLRGLCDVLESHEVGRPDEMIGTMGLESYDLAIVSTSKPTAAYRDYLAPHLEVPIVLITDESEWETMADLFTTMNVRGMIHRHAPAEIVHAAVQEVLAGGVYFDTAACAVVHVARTARLSEIGATERELEVLELLLRGQTNAAIARTLGCTERTVKFHVSNLLRKSGASSRGDLAEKLSGIETRFGLDVEKACGLDRPQQSQEPPFDQ